MSVAEDFNKAVQLWFDLTGLDPNAKSFRLGDLSLVRANEKLKESIELDNSLVTSFMLLKKYSDEYFKEAKVSVAEFDENPEKIMDYMSKVREFKSYIANADITAERDEFSERMFQSLVHYGVEPKEAEKILANAGLVASIRRDALLSMKRIRVDQFLQGDVDPKEVRPLYNPDVFGYWNINSMIDHVCGMPSGVSLNLIRDPDEFQSFFAFAIRNGGNVIMLTDVPEFAHPLAVELRRRPDRDFDERVGKNWFPYDLLAISYDEEGRAFHDQYRAAVSQGLVPHQPTYFTLSKLVKIDIRCLLWVTLMFDLIVERYWNNPIPQKELSYTNEMIRLEDQHKALSAAARSNLPVTGYQPLNLPALTVKDMKSDVLDKSSVGRMSGINSWMEERYGHLVPDSVLNMVGVDEGRVLFLQDQVDTTSNVGGARNLVVRGGTNSMPKQDFDSYQFFNRDRSLVTIRQNDATHFGTRDQIDADRKFIARYNYAKSLLVHAEAECEARKEEIEEWFRGRICANRDFVLSIATHDRWYSRNTRRVDNWDFKEDQRDQDTYLEQLAETALDTYKYRMGYANISMASPYYENERSNWDLCAVTGAASYTYEAFIRPRTINDLLAITGCTMEEIPDVLQHWCQLRDYAGNHILDRVDPLDWAISNPFKEFNFTVRFYLSKRGLARIRKTMKAPVIDGWEFRDGEQ